jgi:hypothetical protein
MEGGIAHQLRCRLAALTVLVATALVVTTDARPGRLGAAVPAVTQPRMLQVMQEEVTAALGTLIKPSFDGGDPVPHILHHVHASTMVSLTSRQRKLVQACVDMHTGDASGDASVSKPWVMEYWDAERQGRFVQTHFGWFHRQWLHMESSPARRRATFVYMLMYEQGAAGEWREGGGERCSAFVC